MSRVYRVALICVSLSLVATSSASSAQLGGLGKMFGGHGGGSSLSGDEADQFLDKATRSTKNVMIAAAILAQAVTDAKNLTSQKSYIEAITNAQDIKELDAHRTEFQSNLDVLNANKDLAGSIAEASKKATAKQREQIGIAVVNLAIGIARNVDLADTAPKVVGAVGHNSQLLMRVGQFKVAASLVGLQAKGLIGVATSMPKLIAATKVKVPSDPKTTDPTPVLL